MKPLNLDNKPCSPISSNCVVWQGPDIPCIELCTGDTVSDVVFQMATELCTILDALKVSNYDLTCFNIQACGPQDFQALIQFLIDKICENQGLTPVEKDEAACPDCVVSVAECFVTGNQTTMQLVDYVQLIGQRICSIITEISLIQDQITDILIRLTDLENVVAPTIPALLVESECAIGTIDANTSTEVQVILQEFFNSVWCDFYSVVGTVEGITNAINLNKCVSETTPTLTNPSINYGDLDGWSDSPLTTLAQSVGNIWILICDLFTYLGTINTLEVQDDGTIIDDNTSVMNFIGDGVTVTGTAPSVIQVDIPGPVDTGWVDLWGFDWYGPDNRAAGRKPQCRRIGNVVHFRGVVMVPLADGSGEPLQWDYDSGSVDTYFNNTTVTPAQSGAGSVILSVGGVVRFNEGQSVVPDTVVDPLVEFDNDYTGSFVIANRFIQIGQYDEGGNTRNVSGMLNTLFQPIITTNKELRLRLIKDFEESAGSTIQQSSNVPYSTSIPNNIISHVTLNDYVGKYDNPASNIGSNPSDLTQPLELYYDSTTGIAPGFRYPFSCNANDQNQVGGFGWVYLDGMTAYLEP